MMRTFRTLVFGIILLGIAVTACKEIKEKETPEVSTADKVETSSDKSEMEEIEKEEMATMLNANLATEADLTKIGMPMEMISQILEKRPFLTMNDFDALIGSEMDKAELYQKIFVPFNLNTTAEEDFKMIPGVGDRMAHEFEEYRPYVSIRQFRTEIGKYVDKDEVSRYESYVFVPIELNTASEETIKALPGVGNRMAHEFEEYRPYTSMEQFRKEIGKYVDDKELARLERLVYLNN
ncbi:helix-hairpin-helix domain-containing protein [Croceitalea rosinachiae]|uniref:Helix-hairpin-helix domain-containing protein n=1 Tax=Croceitalea rosinachiae TaxID=3075596 RepID=A0ABU3AE94_9FLAO|nr:helix-hairpin-helix domain-containing protein [Croceitalea sp. F388]MDT0608238.1 helix-hairpin-helix domain-containing protein [Croceitalea sp. F388]